MQHNVTIPSTGLLPTCPFYCVALKSVDLIRVVVGKCQNPNKSSYLWMLSSTKISIVFSMYNFLPGLSGGIPVKECYTTWYIKVSTIALRIVSKH